VWAISELAPRYKQVDAPRKNKHFANLKILLYHAPTQNRRK
jgi:hypothetical protein